MPLTALTRLTATVLAVGSTFLALAPAPAEAVNNACGPGYGLKATFPIKLDKNLKAVSSRGRVWVYHNPASGLTCALATVNTRLIPTNKVRLVDITLAWQVAPGQGDQDESGKWWAYKEAYKKASTTSGPAYVRLPGRCVEAFGLLRVGPQKKGEFYTSATGNLVCM